MIWDLTKSFCNSWSLNTAIAHNHVQSKNFGPKNGGNMTGSFLSITAICKWACRPSSLKKRLFNPMICQLIEPIKSWLSILSNLSNEWIYPRPLDPSLTPPPFLRRLFASLEFDFYERFAINVDSVVAQILGFEHLDDQRHLGWIFWVN